MFCPVKIGLKCCSQELHPGSSHPHTISRPPSFLSASVPSHSPFRVYFGSNIENISEGHMGLSSEDSVAVGKPSSFRFFWVLCRIVALA